MNKAVKSFYILAFAAILASCAEEPAGVGPGVPQEELVPMTITGGLDSDPSVEGDGGLLAGMATRTTYYGRVVSWEEDDAISVFFTRNDGGVVKRSFAVSELKDNGALALFQGLGLPASGNYVAVYPDLASNTYDGTSLSVTISPQQEGVPNGFASGANASVAYADGNRVVFRNAGGLIAFRFPTQVLASNTASVTVRAKDSAGEYVGLTGASDVTLEVEDGVYVPKAGEGSVDYVKVTSPDGGFLGEGSGSKKTYYAVVYPFEGVRTFEFGFKAKDGTYTWVKNTIEDEMFDGTLLRNTGLAFNNVPTNLYHLPDEIVLDVDFTGPEWPMTPACAPQADQTSAGETYAYRYVNTTEDVVADFEFVISKGIEADAAGYRFGPKGGQNFSILAPALGAYGAWIKLPAIPGRYLKSVMITHCNADGGKRFRLQTASDTPTEATTQYYNSPVVTAPDGATFVETAVTFPTSDDAYGRLSTTEAGTSYYVFFPERGMNINMGHLKVVYTSDQP